MDAEPKRHKPVILIVLDGWGIGPASRANAITSAKKPFFDSLLTRYPAAVLQASGEAAGLPWSEVGNSEVGHMSIGAGRIVFQDLSRINNAIADRSFFSNESFKKTIDHARVSQNSLHIIGMASTSGIHSHIDHLFALCELVQSAKLPAVYLHLFLDGRDAPYSSGLGFIRSVEERIKGTPIRIASLSGRSFAMDRDNHWERTEKAYRAIAEGVSEQTFNNSIAAIEESYNHGVYDEEFIPVTLTKDGAPIGALHDNDALIFFNIRADRIRQLVSCFVNSGFDRFPLQPRKNCKIVTMTQYDAHFPVDSAYPPQTIIHSLSECVSTHNMKQLHIAETEKYAHITYFFNDGREEPFRGEERIMIPSPRVESYAQKPEMSAREITDTVVAAIQNETYDFIAVNYANADMVGHTGDFAATVVAIEILDRSLKRVYDATLAKNGCIIITADHGNAEKLLDLHTGQIDKEHNNNPVPCIIIAPEFEGRSFSGRGSEALPLENIEPHGMLSDIAPTILPFLGIQQPPEMTGTNLLLLL